MNIVLTGSLGHISKPLAKELLWEHHSVTIISSQRDRRPAIEAMGAHAAIGNLLNRDFLLQSFEQADAVYCMVPPNFSHPDQIAYYEEVMSAYVHAIWQTGIKRVIHLSSYGADLPSGTGFITGSYRCEKMLDTLTDVRVTHIRPTYFYYNLLAFIPLIKSAGFIGAVYGDEDPLALVSPLDIAATIAEEIIITGESSHHRYVTSDDRTCNEIAQVLGKAIGKTDLIWKTLAPEQVLKSLLANGVPHNAAQMLVEIGQATHSGILREDFDKHKPAFGKVSLEKFAEDFAIAYQQKQ